MKTRSQWSESRLDFTHFARPGDEVDEDIFNYFLEVLPPKTWTGFIMQCGEPFDFDYKERKNTYITFIWENGKYIYEGTLTVFQAMVKAAPYTMKEA